MPTTPSTVHGHHICFAPASVACVITHSVIYCDRIPCMICFLSSHALLHFFIRHLKYVRLAGVELALYTFYDPVQMFHIH